MLRMTVSWYPIVGEPLMSKKRAWLAERGSWFRKSTLRCDQSQARVSPFQMQ
jgi:hypothetical protein